MRRARVSVLEPKAYPLTTYLELSLPNSAKNTLYCSASKRRSAADALCQMQVGTVST